MVTPICDTKNEPAIRGFLHSPTTPNGNGFVLSHGAGSNCQAPLLVALADTLENVGFEVLRIDLPFRQARPHGPPFPGGAKKDRDGIRLAFDLLRTRVTGQLFAGGHSYGGRQTTILLAEEPQLADGMLLLSYPLHPPKKPAQLRTEHFPSLKTPALFVHGTRDPFGSIAELNLALNLIPSRHALLEVDGAGHDLRGKSSSVKITQIVAQFQSFVNRDTSGRG